MKKISFSANITCKSARKSTLPIYTDWDKDFQHLLEKLKGNGRYLTETEDKSLTKAQESKPMDTTQCISKKKDFSISISTILETPMRWMLLSAKQTTRLSLSTKLLVECLISDFCWVKQARKSHFKSGICSKGLLLSLPSGVSECTSADGATTTSQCLRMLSRDIKAMIFPSIPYGLISIIWSTMKTSLLMKPDSL